VSSSCTILALTGSSPKTYPDSSPVYRPSSRAASDHQIPFESSLACPSAVSS